MRETVSRAEVIMYIVCESLKYVCLHIFKVISLVIGNFAII